LEDIRPVARLVQGMEQHSLLERSQWIEILHVPEARFTDGHRVPPRGASSLLLGEELADLVGGETLDLGQQKRRVELLRVEELEPRMQDPRSQALDRRCFENDGDRQIDRE